MVEKRLCRGRDFLFASGTTSRPFFLSLTVIEVSTMRTYKSIFPFLLFQKSHTGFIINKMMRKPFQLLLYFTLVNQIFPLFRRKA